MLPGLWLLGESLFLLESSPLCPSLLSSDTGPPSQEKSICLPSEGVDKQPRGGRGGEASAEAALPYGTCFLPGLGIPSNSRAVSWWGVYYHLPAFGSTWLESGAKTLPSLLLRSLECLTCKQTRQAGATSDTLTSSPQSPAAELGRGVQRSLAFFDGGVSHQLLLASQ